MTPTTEVVRTEQTQFAPGLLDRIVEQQAAVASRYKPVLSIAEMREREEAIEYLVKHIMREGVDWGWIPGTKPKEDAKPGEYQAKPTLFKAGAERACAFFGYVPKYDTLKAIQEWTGDTFGEMLFYYYYECTLLKDNHAVGAGLGSSSSWESKYRYRNSERVCPQCGRDAIIKGKAEYGGGWLCFNRKGGCGAKFRAGDPNIEGQETGRKPNPDIADVINTVQKQGQKRAYVAATLTATGLSGRFTQDLEDLPAPEPEKDAPPVRAVAANPPASAAESKGAGKSNGASAEQTSAPSPEVKRADLDLEEHLKKINSFKGAVDEIGWAKQESITVFGDDIAYYSILDKFQMQHANQFGSLNRARACFTVLWRAIAEQRERDQHPEMGDAHEPPQE